MICIRSLVTTFKDFVFLCCSNLDSHVNHNTRPVLVFVILCRTWPIKLSKSISSSPVDIIDENLRLIPVSFMFATLERQILFRMWDAGMNLSSSCAAGRAGGAKDLGPGAGGFSKDATVERRVNPLWIDKLASSRASHVRLG